ncbi:hypothetical protein [Streptomyces sp. GbtcB6]|uniref:hypothetical protein n=1 Tax=Streptomyces sp. GbtcB6 TaxID=2824751 RepID=UPI001C2F8F44|nr:hypothetical protein [Streptomyces sp. GbtcB6]
MTQASASPDTTPDAAVDPFAAMNSLRSALDQAGIVLPSLAVDPGAPTLGLIDLGRVRASVALRLAEAIQKGDAAA